MKAVILKEAGDISSLSIEDLPIPQINDDEVLIKIEAFSINPIDVKTRKGNKHTERLLVDQPSILGWDMSGTVVEAGKNITEFGKGSKVFGMLNFPEFGKTYAEYTTAKASDIEEIPTNLGFLNTGATPLAALTAYQSLKYHGNISSNTKVLIHGAGGGVGHFGIQIAKHLGAHVTVTCSASKKDFVIGLGADQHINYKESNFEDEVKDVDVVFDLIGGNYIDRSLKTLKKGGIIICIPSATNDGVEEKAAAKGCTGVAFKVKRSKEDLKEIKTLMEKDILKPFVSQQFHIDDIKEAHTAMENGGTKGKIVVTT